MDFNAFYSSVNNAMGQISQVNQAAETITDGIQNPDLNPNLDNDMQSAWQDLQKAQKTASNSKVANYITTIVNDVSGIAGQVNAVVMNPNKSVQSGGGGNIDSVDNYQYVPLFQGSDNNGGGDTVESLLDVLNGNAGSSGQLHINESDGYYTETVDGCDWDNTLVDAGANPSGTTSTGITWGSDSFFDNYNYSDLTAHGSVDAWSKFMRFDGSNVSTKQLDDDLSN